MPKPDLAENGNRMMGSDLLRTTMLVGVGGSLLTCGLLLTDRFFGKQVCKRLSSVFLALLVAAICWFVFQGFGFRDWWPLAVFVAGFSMGAVGFVPNVEKMVTRVLRPNLVWAGLLAVCVVSANLAAWAYSSPVPTPTRNVVHDVNYKLSSEPSPTQYGFTQTGRKVLLYKFEVRGEDEEDIAYRLKVLDLSVADKYRHNLIRLNEPDSLSNCNGYVFAANRFALDAVAVDNILEDNGYRVVIEPQPGDVVIYRGTSGEVSHSSIVRDVRGVVLVEGKWGPLGVYLHRVELSPFGDDFQYYRSARDSHTIEFAETAGEPIPVE